MARKLPWAQKATGSATTLLPASNGPSSRSANVQQLQRPANRSPSTSPVPQPAPEVLMINGLDHDDQWRMVEDEFLAVAGTHTAHLHKAEYKRLRELAKTRNAAALGIIDRPVIGAQVSELRKRQQRARIQAAQLRGSGARKGRGMTFKKGDGVVDGEAGGESDESAAGATALRGLMDSPRKRVAPLRTFPSSASGGKQTDSTIATLKKPALYNPESHVDKTMASTTSRFKIVPDSDEGDEDGDLDTEPSKMTAMIQPSSDIKSEPDQDRRSYAPALAKTSKERAEARKAWRASLWDIDGDGND